MMKQNFSRHFYTLLAPSKLPFFWRLQISGWLAFVFLTLPLKLIVFGSFSISLIWVVRDIVAFGYTLVLVPLYRRVYQQHSLPKIVIIAGTMSLLGGAAEIFISWSFHRYARIADAHPFSHGIAFAIFYIRTGLFAAWSLLYFGIKKLLEITERDLKLAKAETDRQRAELQLLRMQMNPHFILNGLTALRAMVSKPEQLKYLIEALGNYLRYSLRNSDHDMVPLGSEFDAFKNYLTVEMARFRDELEIECHVDESVRDELVPGVFILPLVDNAIKYGRKTSPLPLKIRLIVTRPVPQIIRIEVANTGSWVDESHPKIGGLGMGNLRHRLTLLYPGHDCLHILKSNDWVRVHVDIPVKP